MSFTFNWPRFSDQFHYDAIHMLNNALNKGNKPPVIADKIEVVELEMGTEAPELEIREVGELTVDQFRGIFRLSYSGDAHLVLKTKVQANPLNHKQPDIHLMTGTKGMLAARQPLVVPMLLRLSHFKLRSIVVLVVSKQKGITLVFKTDPLQNVDINSTFDSIAVIQKFIQHEIEGQLRQMFREDLPGIIHRLSQQWVKAKVEAPYLNPRPPAPPSTQSAPNLSFHNVAQLPTVDLIPRLQVQHLSMASNRSRRPQSLSASSLAGSNFEPPAKSAPVVNESSTFPDLENFDPTYGLRPDGLPTKSVFKGFSSLFSPTKGLADLAEEEETSSLGDFDDNSTSFDVVEWENGLPVYTPPPTVSQDPPTEYEVIPAVGGGLITRPRVLHSQSMIQPPTMRHPSRSHSFENVSLLSGLITPGLSRSSSYNPYFPEASSPPDSSLGAPPQTAPPYFRTHARPITPDSLETAYSSDDLRPETSPPREDGEPSSPSSPIERERRYSISSTPSNIESLDPDPKIVLRPSSINTTLHHLSTLSHSNHTLSPYTRSVQHYTVRSVPPRFASGSAGFTHQGSQPIKAKRKRTYRLGGPPKLEITVPSAPPSIHETHLPSPVLSPQSDVEFDASDMDRYFRTYDDQLKPPLPNGPGGHHSPIRLRKSYMHPENN